MIGAVAALLLADDVHTTYDFSAATEARLRFAETVPGLAPTPPALDLYVIPRLYFEIASPIPSATTGLHKWSFILIDTPSFIEQDTLHADRTELLGDGATLTAQWIEDRTRVALSELGSYGKQSTAYAGLAAPVQGAPPPTLTLLPQTETLTTANSKTAATVEQRVSRELLVNVTASFLMVGGIGAASQAVLPFQYGPRVDVLAKYESSRRDLWITTGEFVDSRNVNGPCLGLVAEPNQPVPECAPQSDIGLVEEVWRHSLTRHSITELGAGFNVTRSHLPPIEPGYDIIPYPVAMAAYAYNSPTTLRYPGYSGSTNQFRLQVALAPTIDYRGLPDDAASATLVYGYAKHRFSIAEQILASDTLGTGFTSSVKAFEARTDVRYTVSRHVAFTAALVYGWLNQAPYGPLSSGYGSLGFLVDSGELRY